MADLPIFEFLAAIPAGLVLGRALSPRPRGGGHDSRTCRQCAGTRHRAGRVLRAARVPRQRRES